MKSTAGPAVCGICGDSAPKQIWHQRTQLFRTVDGRLAGWCCASKFPTRWLVMRAYWPWMAGDKA